MKEILIVLSTISLFSCTNNVVLKADKEIDSAWHTDSLVTFHFNISDTTETYFAELNIRHTVYYTYQNLYVFIHITNPIGETISDTINCILSDKRGKWKGKKMGDILDFTNTYHEAILFETQGEYKIEIEQAMRYGKSPKIEKLKEIASVGICIKKY